MNCFVQTSVECFGLSNFAAQYIPPKTKPGCALMPFPCAVAGGPLPMPTVIGGKPRAHAKDADGQTELTLALLPASCTARTNGEEQPKVLPTVRVD